MNRRFASTIFAGANLGVSGAMSVLIAFLPFAYESAGMTRSAVDVNGFRIVPLLFAHTAAAAYFFYLTTRKPETLKMARSTMYMFAVAFIVYPAVTVGSFGLFYIPSAVLVLAAAVLFPETEYRGAAAPMPVRRGTESGRAARRRRRKRRKERA